MRGRAQKRAFGSAMAIASVVAMTACGSSGSKPDTQAVPTQPAQTQASTTSPSTTGASPTSASPTSTASKAKEFVSERYGFAVTLPDAFAEVDATVDWGGQYISGPGSNQFANFPDFATDRTLMAAAAAVPPGTQLADWEAAMVRGTPDECPAPSSVENTTLGGEPALLWTLKCSDGYDVIHLVALHGDRGYMFYMGSSTANDDAEDLRIFDEARQSFRFTS